MKKLQLERRMAVEAAHVLPRNCNHPVYIFITLPSISNAVHNCMLVQIFDIHGVHETTSLLTHIWHHLLIHVSNDSTATIL